MTNILSLDIGTTFGWSLDGQSAEHVKLPQDDTKFAHFAQYIRFFIQEHDIDIIAYEHAAYQPGNAIPVYHGLVGVLKSIAEEMEAKVVAIPVGTVKKAFLGTGRPSKEQQAEAAKRLGWKKKPNSKCMTLDKCNKLGLQYTDENAADALSVWHAYQYLYIDKGNGDCE